MYRYLCMAACKTYSPTFALADNNNNIITVYGKSALYEIYINQGISNITMRQTKSGNIVFGNGSFVQNHCKNYRITDAWSIYNCQSGELGGIIAQDYAQELINRGF